MTFLRRLWGESDRSHEGLSAWRHMPRGWFMLLLVVVGWLVVGLFAWLVVLLVGG